MKKMLSIMLVFLILIGLTESVTASEGTDEGHGADKKGKKVHVHAQEFKGKIDTMEVVVLVDGEEISYQLSECGKSSGQFMTNIDIPKLKEKIQYFLINGDRHNIGAGLPITLGKEGEDGHDHEVTETTGGEDDGATEGSEGSHEEGQGKGKCKGKDKEKGGHETVEETTTVQGSEQNGQEFDLESSLGAAVQVTSQAAVSAEEGHEESHEEGGGALNYWMNKLLDRYTITATANPIGTASLNIDELYYLEDEDVDVGFIPVNGRYISKVERTTSGAISVDVTNSLILLNDVLTDQLTDLSSNVEYLVETEAYLGVQVHANIQNSIASNEHNQYRVGNDASFTVFAKDDYLIKLIQFDDVTIDAMKVTKLEVTIPRMLVDTDVFVTVEKIKKVDNDEDKDDEVIAGTDGETSTGADGGASTGTEGGTTGTAGGITPTSDITNPEAIPAEAPDGEELEFFEALDDDAAKADDNAAKADDNAVILEEALPQADGELPKTGGFPLEGHLIIGFVSSGIGTLLRRKNKR